MRAIVTRVLPDTRREKALVDDWPPPDAPTTNQVMTVTLYSGLTNGTELNQLTRGNYAPPDERLPAVHGYQNVGRVVAVGPAVADIRPGDLLFTAGKHQEYVVMPEDGVLTKLPATVDLTHAALLGMASVATHSCRHAEITLGERVLVVGAGCVGQFAAQVAAAMGAAVTLCDIDRERLAIARRIGAAEEVVDTSGDGWNAGIPTASFDVVLDFAGVPGMEDRLIQSARRRGRVLLVAGRARVHYTFNVGQGREITIRQNSSFERTDLVETCRLLAKEQLQVGPLIRDIAPVAQAQRIYTILRDRPAELLGTVFVW